MTKLAELKAAYAASTQGEWVAPGFNSQGGEVACLLANHDGLRLVSGNFKRPDAKFIALAHNNMAALLEAVVELGRFVEYLGVAGCDGAYDREIERAVNLLENLK